MKKEQNKGITLLAIVITVIILLLLSAITIGIFNKDEIITYAENAKNEATRAQKKRANTDGNK